MGKPRSKGGGSGGSGRGGNFGSSRGKADWDSDWRSPGSSSNNNNNNSGGDSASSRAKPAANDGGGWRQDGDWKKEDSKEAATSRRPDQESWRPEQDNWDSRDYQNGGGGTGRGRNRRSETQGWEQNNWENWDSREDWGGGDGGGRGGWGRGGRGDSRRSGGRGRSDAGGGSNARSGGGGGYPREDGEAAPRQQKSRGYEDNSAPPRPQKDRGYDDDSAQPRPQKSRGYDEEDAAPQKPQKNRGYAEEDAAPPRPQKSRGYDEDDEETPRPAKAQETRGSRGDDDSAPPRPKPRGFDDESQAAPSNTASSPAPTDRDPHGHEAEDPASPLRAKSTPLMPMPCQDIRYEVGFEVQDVRYTQDPQDSKSSRSRGGRDKGGGGGRDRRGGGGGGGNNGGAEASGEGGDKEKSKRSGGRNRGGGGGGGGGGGAGNGEVNSAMQAISSRVRKYLAAYEETQMVADLEQAYKALEAATMSGEGCCDAGALEKLLCCYAKMGKTEDCDRIGELAASNQVYLDVSAIVSVAMAISQRAKGWLALRYLRDKLIWKTLPPDFGDEETQFVDRHVSFIFSELMAEADGCVARIENRDSHVLVALGHTEEDMRMDWAKSTASSFILYNRQDDKGRRTYQPTVLQSGFQRTDFALMSFDISQFEVASQVARDYDKIKDGAEVEVVESAGPGQSAPLRVRLTSPGKVPFMPNMAYRLDRLASKDQTRRMLMALQIMLRKPVRGTDNEEGGQSSLQPAEQLRELILIPPKVTLKQAGKTDIPLLVMDWGPGHPRNAAIRSFQEESPDRYNASLNKSQVEALMRACTQRITLIQGPPGTGKTTTAVQIVLALVEYGLVDLPMLVTADSNTAVDNLVKGIGKRGINVVRVGRPESIREDVKQYSLDGRWKELKKAQVVCATCIGASGTTLDKVRFSTVLIDECTQAAESAALVPLAKGCQQAILIGDQCQLPPTVLSDMAENENLGESLFTRLVTQGVRPVLLDTQYRMHPLIAEFASASFYNGRLQNGVAHFDRKPPEGFPWPQRQMPVAFWNLERGEEKREGSSYINPAEAEKTLNALQEVCKNDILSPEDVGIVTPYKGQVNMIKKLIRERPGLQKFRTGLEVESVDGFQGQEKEVIIFCAVRNNREGKVGFLSDWRRLNVMLTRARRGCIVIGSRSTLVSDGLWQQWLLWAAARGAIIGESAKGTWVPKYLVDDRDGVWTVKAELQEGAGKGAPGVVPIDTNIPEKRKQASPEKETEIVDSWEDLGSPLGGPSDEDALQRQVTPMEDLAASAEDVEEEAAPASPAPPAAAEPHSTAGAAVSGRMERLESPSSDQAADATRSGTPNKGMKSPSRQLALAKLGLVDDLDLDESQR